MAGWVRNDSRGVTIEAEAEGRVLAAFTAALHDRAPPLAAISPPRRELPASRGDAGFAILASDAAAAERRADRPGQPRLPRLPARALRPGRPPLPLPVHQLHQLRPALQHRHRHPLRPAPDHHGRLRHVPGLPARIRGPGRPPFPRPAQRLPGVRTGAEPAATAGARRWRLPTRCLVPLELLRGRAHRRHQGAGRIPPGGGRRQRRGGGRAAPAQGARREALRPDGRRRGAAWPPSPTATRRSAGCSPDPSGPSSCCASARGIPSPPGWLPATATSA